MPSFSTPYHGIGSYLPPGYQETLNLPGAYLNRAITGAADSLAQGLQSYAKNREESQYYDGVNDNLASMLKGYSGQVPQDQIDTIVSTLNDASAGSLAKKRAAFASGMMMADRFQQRNAEAIQAEQLNALQADNAQRAAEQVGYNSLRSALGNYEPEKTIYHMPPTMEIGSLYEPKETRVPKTDSEAIREIARRSGALPSVVNKEMQAAGLIGREPGLSATPIPGTSKLVASKGKDSWVVDREDSSPALTPTEQAAQDARTVKVALPSLGVAFDGVAPSLDEAKTFRELFGTLDTVNSGVDELLNISATPNKSLSPQARAKAKTVSQMLIGALRLPIVGPGALSEKEQELLQSIVANPTKLMSLDDSNREALNTLRTRLAEGVNAKARSLGLVAPSTTESKVLAKPKWNPITGKLENP